MIQVFKSTDTNAPVLTGQTNKLVALLSACLVDGYTTASVTSITRSSNTATVTIASNTTLVTGDWITIAGANETDYNGTFQITVTSSTTFTYTVANSPATPATGTITYAKAGLGWARPFAAGTNAQTYRAATGNRYYLQIVDNAATAGGALEAQLYGAEVMSADQTVTSGRFPTSAQLTNGLCVRKSGTADATARAWCLVGDGTRFYLQINAGASVTTTWLYGFGDFPSHKSGDAYNTFVFGAGTFNSSAAACCTGTLSASSAAPSAATGLYVPRGQAQTGTALNAGMYGFGTATAGSGTAIIAYPNAADSGAYVAPMILTEVSGASWRGRFPGLYNILHNLAFTNYDTITGVTGLTGVTLLVLNAGTGATQCQVAIDTIGPWT